jgi:hypothetical protein
MKRQLYCALLMVLTLAGCATSTTYREDNFANRLVSGAGGFDDMRIGDGIYVVTFSANDTTTRTTMQTYWLYRCAELALANGYDGFEVSDDVRLSAHDDSRSETLAIARFYSDLLTVRGTGIIFVPSFTYMVPPVPLSRISGQVRFVKGSAPTNPPTYFDARALKSTLAAVMAAPRCDRDNICEHEKHYLRPLVQGKPRT